ncbi:MAG: hypothetical protein H7Z43_03625 [Clostridia bacterium]|nr:hypothetical protein [Deltaproteobacteria bacterium]
MSWFTMLGAIIGAALGTLAGFYGVGWWSSPGYANEASQTQCPCVQHALHTAETLIECQAVGAIIGVVVLNFIGISIRNSFARRAAARSAARPATPIV